MTPEMIFDRMRRRRRTWRLRHLRCFIGEESGVVSGGGSTGGGAGGGGSAGAAPSSAPSPAATPPAAAPASAPSSQPSYSPPAGGGGAAGPAAPAFSLRQFAEQHVPGAATRYTDDAALARDLFAIVQQHQQSQPFIQAGQRYQQHATEFEKWHQQQEQARQAEAAKQKQWWTAPEYDPNWLNQVYQDPNTGQLVSKPGAPLDLPQRIAAWRNFQAEKSNEFFRDPMKTIQPGIEQTVMPMIQQAIERRINDMEAARFAQGYVQQNLGWIAQKDAQGNPVPDGRGGWVMTAAGQRMAEYVDILHKSGVTNPQVQQQLAEKMVLGDLARIQSQQAQQPPPAAAPAAAPAAPAFAGLAPGSNYGAAPTGSQLKPNQSLHDALTEGFAQAGLLGKQLV